MPRMNIEKCPSVGLYGMEIPNCPVLPSAFKKGIGTNRPSRYTAVRIIVTRSGLRNTGLGLKLKMFFYLFHLFINRKTRIDRKKPAIMVRQ